MAEKSIVERISPGPKVPDVVNAIIEIPKGSRNKYEFDKKNNTFKLDRVLYSPFVYSADYGIIPQTVYDDGDPLDILVIMDQPSFPGCLIEARPIGLLKMVDGGKYDDKILAVSVSDPRYNDVTDIDDVAPHTLDEIAHFFQHYKDLEKKMVQIKGWENSIQAKKAIEHAVKLYKRKKS